jgi:hypothetical protein
MSEVPHVQAVHAEHGEDTFPIALECEPLLGWRNESSDNNCLCICLCAALVKIRAEISACHND